MAHTCSRGERLHQLEGMFKTSARLREAAFSLRSHFGGVGLTRGAYMGYVSTAKWRERPLACLPKLQRRLTAFFNIPTLVHRLTDDSEYTP